MRIVHFGKYYSPFKGGMETHVETLAKHQVKLGHEVHVLAVNGAGNNKSSLDRIGYTTERVFDDEGVKVHLLGRYSNFCKFDFARKARRLIQSHTRSHETIFHLHAPNPTFTMKIASIPRIGHLVVSHHSDLVGQGLMTLPFRLIESRIYARAKSLISDSEQYISGSQLLSRFRAKTRVLPLGIDLEKFAYPSPAIEELATKLRRENPNPIWLCVGRICKYKGFETAIKALTKVAGTLLIVGTGPKEDELKLLARNLAVEERIRWLGETDQNTLIASYHSARALWFTSNARNEGFGQVQVESMACSTPVINTHIEHSGVDWVSLDKVSGLTIPTDCVPSLVETSNRLATDDNLHRELALGARRRAEELFDAKQMAISSVLIYENL